MKKFAAVCLLTAILFASCGVHYDYGADESIITVINDACGKVSDSETYKGSFVLNMLFSEEDATLMFAQGSYDADLTGEMPCVTANMTQTVLGTNSGVQVSYANGVCTTTKDGTPYDEEMTPEQFFGRIIYTKPFIPEPEYIKGIDKVSSAEGNGYKVYLKGAEDALYPLVGDGIYTLAMIKSPQYDLMNIKDAYITYIIDEISGRVKNMTISFTLYIYETPPYVPNKNKTDLYDYTLDIRILYNVAFG